MARQLRSRLIRRWISYSGFQLDATTQRRGRPMCLPRWQQTELRASLPAGADTWVCPYVARDYRRAHSSENRSKRELRTAFPGATGGFVDYRGESDPIAGTRSLQVWELAVIAKGGRQKLEQVNSLAVFYEYSKGRLSTELYAFPDKRWDWYDTGPSSKFPLLVSAMDFEQKVYCVNHRYIREGCEPIGNFSKRGYLEDPQLLYLLETKWVKPELLAASKGTLGFRSVKIVKVQLETFQISVYLDSKTHFP